MKNFPLILLYLFASLSAQEPAEPPTVPAAEPVLEIPTPFLAAVAKPEGEPEMMQPQYRGAALDILLQEIAARTGKVMLRDPQVAEVQITLVSRQPMPVTEFLKAAESVLNMHGIALVPFRDRFIKVVPSAGIERGGAPLVLDPEQRQGEQDQVISQVVALQHLEYSEVEPLISERLSPNAKLQVLERRNSFLITDTRSNIGRIQEILQLLDRPGELREAVKIYALAHASAPEVKARLDSLVEQSRQNQGTTRSSPTSLRAVSPVRPGVVNAAPVQVRMEPEGGGSANPSLIRGNVQIEADERTNILIIISRPENDAFFEEMIGALDRRVDPEVGVRIVNLQFSDAEITAATLNELIGAAANTAADAPVASATASENREGQTLREFIRQQATPPAATSPAGAGTTGIGRVSNTTRILPDVRTNALILMGKSADLDVLESVISKLDVMLAQVAVRAVILEVGLTDNLAYGIDWLQRSLTVNQVDEVNGVKIREPVMSFAGAQNLGADATPFRDAAAIDRAVEMMPGSLTYFSTFYDFNLDAVLRLAQGSNQAKVIATPIIITADNTEGSISVGERRAIPTTTATTIGGSVQSSFEYENIGLELTVTPRINPQGMVIMEISQTTENVGGSTTIDGNEVPIITSRALQASVAIRSGGTLVLGGLVREEKRERITKVPFLGSIPLLGVLFRSRSTEDTRTELLVLISPQVLLTSEEAEALTRELKRATELENADWYQGWDANRNQAPKD